MNNFMSREQVEYYKEKYPAGTKIVLDSMENDPCPIPSGTKGVTTGVDDAGNILVKWSNGRSLSIIPIEDSFHIDEESEDIENEISDKIQEVMQM